MDIKTERVQDEITAFHPGNQSSRIRPPKGTNLISLPNLIDRTTLRLGLRRTVINCFWHGDSLSWIERACLKSFVTNGFRVRLFSYQPVAGIPKGVVLRDANLVLPENDLFFYDGPNTPKSKGTPATFSDYFRYKIQDLNFGIWMDCDVYCLKPFEFASKRNVFAWENKNRVSSAVLKLKSNSPVLSELLSLFQPPFEIPRWVSESDRTALIEKHGGPNIHPRFLPWGTVGPIALHFLLSEAGMLDQALARRSFFPVLVWDLDNLFDPDFDLTDHTDEHCFGIHLWNNEIRHRRETIPPVGSFLHKVWQEGQV